MAIDFDIKEKIEEVVDKLKNDKTLLKKFEDEPVKTIEELVGIDLPDEKLEALIDGIKAKLAVGSIGDALGKLGGLFGKK